MTKTLKRLREVLSYYANSTIGEEQVTTGIYQYDPGDGNCICYDPSKAKEGLRLLDEIKEENKEDLIRTIKEVIEEFMTYFNPESEYGIGYLDCLIEICEKLSIPTIRTENGLMIKDCSTCSNLEIESMTGVCSEKGIIESIPVNCTSWKGEK